MVAMRVTVKGLFALAAMAREEGRYALRHNPPEGSEAREFGEQRLADAERLTAEAYDILGVVTLEREQMKQTSFPMDGVI